ncbi:hypothetical protein NDK43_07910 [Neobacillus pocheonensis]|uniref:Uncharacterized protein n=1 Tax=Neobacillus pocheonensis TaxID=363869 RepID=A0ABT0W7P9_9BACI|nr:hypothetical protein [Neobacillus pocheonensis]
MESKRVPSPHVMRMRVGEGSFTSGVETDTSLNNNTPFQNLRDTPLYAQGQKEVTGVWPIGSGSKVYETTIYSGVS